MLHVWNNPHEILLLPPCHTLNCMARGNQPYCSAEQFAMKVNIRSEFANDFCGFLFACLLVCFLTKSLLSACFCRIFFLLLKSKGRVWLTEFRVMKVLAGLWGSPHRRACGLPSFPLLPFTGTDNQEMNSEKSPALIRDPKGHRRNTRLQLWDKPNEITTLAENSHFPHHCPSLKSLLKTKKRHLQNSDYPGCIIANEKP